MSPLTDDQLLRRFSESNDRGAFDEIARRHAGVVYSACRRELRSSALAEDAAQATFILLARKASSLKRERSLAGWLFTSAVLVSRTMLREERRRRAREERAVEESGQNMLSARESTWQRIEPLLNEAMSDLKPAEREAVALRYLEGLSLAEVGTRTGASEDAARMRASRGIERLRKILAKSGVTLSTAILAGALESSATAATALLLSKVSALPAAIQGASGMSAQITLAKGVAAKMTILASIKTFFTVTASSAGIVLIAATAPSSLVPDIIEEPARNMVWAVVGQKVPYRAPAELVGRWERVKVEWDGIDQTPGLTGSSFWMLGSSGSWEGTYKELSGRGGGEKGIFRADPSKSPPTFDFTAGTGTSAKKYLGIYTVKDDLLVVCYGQPGKPRPTELRTERGWKADVMMETFRRVRDGR